ncbi:MAG: hypothetical protein MUP76_05835 [Acidimicrobiia bacterium]|nr:hypothetical protein [Acidimicrobiia bacterium]
MASGRMRIALHADGEVGKRAGRILLAEPDLVALGMYGNTRGAEDRRTTAIRSLTGYNPLVTDAPDGRAFAAIAAEEGVSCVVAGRPRIDRRLARKFLDRGLTLLVASDLSGGIAETLAAHELVSADLDSAVAISWTEEGRPLRRGEAIPFPDPVGPRWGSRLGPRPRRRQSGTIITRFVVPVPGEWAGAAVRVTGTRDGHTVKQIVGVADHGIHLGAIALAAGAIAVAEGSYPPGVHQPSVAADSYLSVALRIGLGVASHTINE